MGIVKRQFLKASFATYVGVALGYLNITILFPYFCTPEQLGLYRVIINMAALFAAIAYMGAPQTIIKQLPLFKKNKQEKEFYGLLALMFFATLFLSFLILFFLKGPVIEFFSDKSPEVGKYYFYSVFIAFTLAIYVIFISNVRIIRRVAFPALLKDVFLRIFITADILLLGFQIIDFEQFVVILCSEYAALAIAGVIYSYRLVPFKMSFKIGNIPSREIGDTLNFSLLTFLASISNIIIMNADSLMITALSKDGLVDTGIYTIAFFIGSTLEIPRRIINLVTAPVISEYWVDQKLDEIKKVYKSSSTNALILGSLIFGLIWLNLDSIFALIPNSEVYIEGMNVVLIILFARLFEMSCILTPNILTQTKLYMWNLPLSLLLVFISVATNYMLIPLYGISGAAIATLISVVVYNSLKVILVKYKFGMQPYSRNSNLVLLIFGLCLIPGVLLPVLPNIFIDITVRSILFVIPLALILFYASVSEDYNNYFRRVMALLSGKK